MNDSHETPGTPDNASAPVRVEFWPPRSATGNPNGQQPRHNHSTQPLHTAPESDAQPEANDPEKIASTAPMPKFVAAASSQAELLRFDRVALGYGKKVIVRDLDFS